ncbi:MAG: GAF domain-containing protein [Anaerolineales bacterium]|nr:GAF domain-containing protein [Anaerolineales bacterium]
MLPTTKPQVASLNDQLAAAAKQTASLRNSVDPAEAARELQILEQALKRISETLAPLEQQFNRLQALTDIGQVVNSTLEIDEVLKTVMDTIIQLTEAERGFLMLHNEHGEMVIRVARNWEQESINPSEAFVSRSSVQKVIDSGEAVLTTNALEDQRFSNQESIIALNVRSILCVPLKVKTEPIGVIYVDNRIRSGVFTQADCDLLSAFANQAAVAIEHARLFSSLKHTFAEATELKNFMDNVFASIASGVITVDAQDQITLCNRAAATILKHAPAEIIGQKIGTIIPALANQVLPRLEAVRTHDEPVVGLALSQTSTTSEKIEWRMNLSPLKDADQKIQGVAIVLDDLTEYKKLEAQRGLLQRMVSPAVLDQIDLNSLQADGKQASISILFADIRGFTAYSEKHPPEELVAVLNQYLATAAEAALTHEGTVGKFLGDAVMVWYNAPIPQSDHTLRAVKTALDIRRAVAGLHAKLPPNAWLDFGMGIHCGEAVLGWIGSEKRLEFAAIGDSVNTAKRIQENCARDQILISKEAYERVKDRIIARPFEPLVVKGKTHPLDVFEVIELK